MKEIQKIIFFNTIQNFGIFYSGLQCKYDLFLVNAFRAFFIYRFVFICLLCKRFFSRMEKFPIKFENEINTIFIRTLSGSNTYKINISV